MSIKLTRNEMMAIELPDYEKTYTVVSNRELIDTTLESFDKGGFRLVKENYTTQKGKSKFVGVFNFESPMDEYNISFAWRNSYDKSMSAGYVIGMEILVCENGAFSGEEKILRKHTGKADTDLKIAIKDGVEKFTDQFNLIEKDLEVMKNIDLTVQEQARLIGDMYINHNLINPNQLSVIKAEILKSTFDYGVENSLYNIYNHCTHAFKDSHVMTYLSQHQNLHNFVKDVFKL